MVTAHAHSVLALLVVDAKRVILGEPAAALPVPHVDPESVVTLRGQPVQRLRSDPELPVRTAESVLVVVPRSPERHRAVDATLYNRPSGPVHHLTVEAVGMRRSVGSYLVDSAGRVRVALVDLIAICLHSFMRRTVFFFLK
jgi:hypothetical protein